LIRFLSLPGVRRLERYFNLDVAFRYLRARDILGANPSERILEIGSAGEGFGRYADVTLTAVESRAGGASSRRRVRVVRASGTSLPFRDRGFGAVLSVDVLEHVPPADRPVFLRECLRVAARRLVLIFPSGEAAEEQDRELYAYGDLSSTGPDDMLREHLANGLPAAEEVARLLHASGRPMEIIRGKSMNLRVRRWIMRRWMGPGVWNLAFYRAGVLLLPFRRRLDAGPCYRAVLDVRLR
jgi:SAM-dependent methyltransferase